MSEELATTTAEPQNLTPTGELAEVQPTKVTEQDTHTPADVAAVFFMRNKGILKQNLDKLSLRQIKRVLFAIAAYPLAGEYNPKSDEEKAVAYLINEMMFNKSIMSLQAEIDRAEKTRQKEETEKMNNLLETKQGETENGIQNP